MSDVRLRKLEAEARQGGQPEVWAYLSLKVRVAPDALTLADLNMAQDFGFVLPPEIIQPLATFVGRQCSAADVVMHTEYRGADISIFESEGYGLEGMGPYLVVSVETAEIEPIFRFDEEIAAQWEIPRLRFYANESMIETGADGGWVSE